jgi:nucleoside-diphosphate-sugar epimerase
MSTFHEIKKGRVLVTGTSGFIGSHLCRTLHEAGVEVHGVSRKNHQTENTYVHWWHGDLVDFGFVHDLLRNVRPSIIFHLASYVSGSRDLNMVLLMFRNNLMTTVNLLTVATEYCCHRIVLAGSLEEPVSPDDTIPCSPYAAAKWASSGYARMFHSLYQTPVVIARLFMVYGPGQRDLSKLIPYVTLSLLRNEAPKLSSGRREVDWIYIEDAVDGLIAAAQAPDIEGSTIDLGSGSLIQIRTVVEHLVTLVNPKIDPLFGALHDRPMEQVRVADIAEAFAKIGWRPATSLEKGLALTLDWYRNCSIQSEKKESGEKGQKISA